MSAAPEQFAFLSYSHTDREVATRLVNDLSACGISVRWDANIPAGAKVDATLDELLDNSFAVLVLISNASLGSANVGAEIARTQAAGKRLLPVQIEELELGRIPRTLQQIQFAILYHDWDRVIVDLCATLAETRDELGINASANAVPIKAPRKKVRPAVQKNIQSSAAVDDDAAEEVSQEIPQQQTVSPSEAGSDQPPAVSPEKIQRIKLEIAAQALSDKPITSVASDKLGFRPYVEALSDFILSPRTTKPLTIAIDAAWGSGKTSLMNMLKEEIRRRDRHLPVVWFNAWKYDKEEALWAALAFTITNATKDLPRFTRWTLNFQLWQSRFSSGKLLRDLLNRIGLLIGFILITILTLSLLLTRIGQDFAASIQQILALILTGGSVIAAITVGQQIWKYVNEFFVLKLNDYMKRPNYGDRIGYIAEFEEDFAKITNVITQNGSKPLIVFIDDLDRCSPGRAVEVIEAINLFLDQDNCVFIIGMDAKAVAASIEVRYDKMKDYFEREYGSDVSFGQRFLEKMVQINFRFPALDHERMMQLAAAALEDPKPPLSRDRIAKAIASQPGADGSVSGTTPVRTPDATLPTRDPLVEEQAMNFDSSDEVKAAVASVIQYFDYNPRRIKRFANLFRLQSLIINRMGLFVDKTIQLDRLAKWTALAMLYPDFVEALANDDSTDDRVLDALDRSRTASEEADPVARRNAIRDALPTLQMRRFFDARNLEPLLRETQAMSAEEVRNYSRLVRVVSLSASATTGIEAKADLTVTPAANANATS